jgi:hypothetical protein
VKALQERTGSTTGGRIGRAAGGKVDHEALVRRLMNKFKEARRLTNQSTQPLLKVTDSAMAHALKVAQEAI